MKNLVLTALFLGNMSLHAQNLDSARFIIFNALITTQVEIYGDAEKLLANSKWEALAYWEKASPKEIDFMQEAVADIYAFANGDFTIELRDPAKPGEYLPPVVGKYQLKGNAIYLQRGGGKTILLEIFYLDKNYMVVEIDGMRLFFTVAR